MFENVVSTLQVLLAFVGGFAAGSDVGTLGFAVAAAIVAGVVIAVVAAVAAPASTARSGPHPRRAIDLSATVTQSDPDAAGHPRPRAPQFAASAA